MSHPLKLIRVISDGRAGHQNQSIGLAQALARRTAATVDVIQIPTSFNLITRYSAAATMGAGIPQLLVGAGHKVHLPIWLCARKFAARSVVIMAPTWPKSLFDLCILPQHDLATGNQSPRIITTLGALNRIPEESTAKQARGVILIGGPSKSHGWAVEQIVAAISDVVGAKSGLQWTISDSRRTPAGFLEQLRAKNLAARILSHQQTPPDWVPAQLMAATEAWATEDSVSMLFEAVTAGAQTGILPAPVIRPDADPVRAIGALIEQGYAMHYQTWQRSGRTLLPPRPLHETGRCADLILERLFPASQGFAGIQK